MMVGALMTLGLAACGDGSPPRPVSPVKVGALFPLSGDLADKGGDSANGVRLAVEEINAAGGVASLGGAKLELVLGDTQGRPEVGTRETERLIKEEGAAALIGTYQSSVTKVATQVAERLETPFIVSISIADVITERGFQYTFRIQPKAGFYARDQVRFLKDLEALAGLVVRRVALLHENTDFGTSTALSQKQALREHGLEVVAEVSYRAEGVTDLEAEVAQVLAARPDAILTVTYLKDSLLIRQALVKSGSTAIMLDTAGGTVSPEYVQTLGPLADDTFTVAEFSKFVPGGKELNDRFRARFKVDITGDSAHAYQAVLVLKAALEKAGAADRQRLRSAIAATDLEGGPLVVLPAERLRFDASGQNQYASLFVVQIKGGELVPVWPQGQATAKVKLPK
jgi:branched-chain amino acid transport system substrate-binding protein